MSFSAVVIVLLCACCWIAVVIAKTGLMREKRGAQDQQQGQQDQRGRQILREALDKHKHDVPDVRNVREVRGVRAVSLLKNLQTRRNRRE